MAHATAESKPNVIVVAARSLSIVFGTPTMGNPASCICCAIVNEPSPPTETKAVNPSCFIPSLVASSNSLATAASRRARSWREPAAIGRAENRPAAHQQTSSAL